jgi:hypothetical protein
MSPLSHVSKKTEPLRAHYPKCDRKKRLQKYYVDLHVSDYFGEAA